DRVTLLPSYPLPAPSTLLVVPVHRRLAPFSQHQLDRLGRTLDRVLKRLRLLRRRVAEYPDGNDVRVPHGLSVDMWPADAYPHARKVSARERGGTRLGSLCAVRPHLCIRS